MDIKSGKTITWDLDHKEQIATEPIFVPKPDGIDEDDGEFLSFVTIVILEYIFRSFIITNRELLRRRYTIRVDLGRKNIHRNRSLSDQSSVTIRVPRTSLP